jgi:hypothetical protein
MGRDIFMALLYPLLGLFKPQECPSYTLSLYYDFLKLSIAKSINSQNYCFCIFAQPGKTSA